MISKVTKEHTEEEINEILHPLVSKWFFSKFRKFSPPQKQAINKIYDNRNILISAPTGSGKTFSAFLGIISKLLYLSENNQLENKVYAIYISPLRALANDIQRNLREPLDGIKMLANRELGIRIAVRTGDTSQNDRSKMLKLAPHILILTPETLAILITAPKFRELLKDVKWVITDEIHALANNKRGVHLSLTLERLQNIAGEFTRIGLSATIAPLDEIANFLVGFNIDGKPRNCDIVDASFDKKLDLKVISPVENIMDISYGQMEKATYDLLHKLVQEHKTTLIFTNTRAATERVVHELNKRFPKFYGENLQAHHSSLSKELRLNTETMLKQGKLKCVVSSTSLELGIDIGYVDLVVLLGSPKSVSRALQRIGRSGHKLHDTIKGRFVVIDRDDLIEDALIFKHSIERKIDRIDIPRNCLDVLAQQIYGHAIEEVDHIENVLFMIRRSYCYKTLTREDFMAVIKYLCGDYSELELRHVYAKIWYDEKTGMVGKRSKLARVLYSTNIGTIPDEAYITVKIGEQPIGKIDELFLERMKPGDIFVLGGRPYLYKYSRGMTVQVSSAEGRSPTIPAWFSEMLPLNLEVAEGISLFRKLMREKFQKKAKKAEIMKFIEDYLYIDGWAANSIYEYYKEQFSFALIPTNKEILVEKLSFEDKHYLIFSSCYGRRVNDALSRGLAYLFSKMTHRSIAIGLTDQNFYLQADKPLNLDEALEQMKKENFVELLKLAIDKTEVFRRRFRHCAGRSLMILRNYKGQRKTAGRQQVSSEILINSCRRISNEFPILKEARREVLEDLMDVENASTILKKILNSDIRIKQVQTSLPSPFSINIIARGYSDILKMEDKLEFIRRMHQMVLAKIGKKVNMQDD